MSIGTTNPATQIGDAVGNRATLDMEGVRTFQEVKDRELIWVVKELIEEVKLLRLAIYELNNA